MKFVSSFELSRPFFQCSLTFLFYKLCPEKSSFLPHHLSFPPVILSRVTTSSQGKIFQSSAGSRKKNCGRIKRRGGSSQREVDWKIHNPPSTLSNHSFPLKRFRHKKLDVLTIEWKMFDDALLISHWGLVWQDWSEGKSCPGQLETAHIAKNAALQQHIGISPMNGSRV